MSSFLGQTSWFPGFTGAKQRPHTGSLFKAKENVCSKTAMSRIKMCKVRSKPSKRELRLSRHWFCGSTHRHPDLPTVIQTYPPSSRPTNRHPDLLTVIQTYPPSSRLPTVIQTYPPSSRPTHRHPDLLTVIQTYPSSSIEDGSNGVNLDCKKIPSMPSIADYLRFLSYPL